MNLPGKEVWYDWDGANEWLFKHINSIHNEYYDNVMIALSNIADDAHVLDASVVDRTRDQKSVISHQVAKLGRGIGRPIGKYPDFTLD